MSATETLVQVTAAPEKEEKEKERWPHWVVEFDRLIAVRPQFVISGNIRDNYVVSLDGKTSFLPLVDCLFARLKRRGCEGLFIYDHVDGLRLHAGSSADLAARVPVPLHSGPGTPDALKELPSLLRAVARAAEVPCAFVVDYASRLVTQPQHLGDAERALFAACEKLAYETTGLRSPQPDGPPPFNPIVWLINRPRDLPDWFVVRNECIRMLTASLPDRETRADAATKLAEDFIDYTELEDPEREKYIGQFADLTEGETVRSMLSIQTLACEQGVRLAGVSDAVRLYKLGLPDNPWKKGHLRDKLRHPEEVLGRRVKGQQGAARKSMEILIRSAMGMSGAQASAQGGRPRGVLFFAGPTGVGKTELAKAITELIFGDYQAYRRFDMSEFSAEQSEARLIGAPPGFTGHDAGGELVNAVRERPFSVLLFDEIEKAHPRILDKFLQILEDGRLTDGRGETVHFSETVIIFTSNLGIYREERSGSGKETRVERVQLVQPDTLPAKVEAIVRQAIHDEFRYKLGRPEILNRIGDNIVVFNFIDKNAATEIFDVMLENVKARVRKEHSLALSIPDGVVNSLRDHCTEKLDFGGRGVGNRFETAFINPLAVALFEAAPTPDGQRQVTVREVVEGDEGARNVVLEWT